MLANFLVLNSDFWIYKARKNFYFINNDKPRNH